MLAVGAFAERAHLGPILVFIFLWSTLVYDPIACWTWNPNGWSSVHGSYDFAGGTPVHISSGSAALAISMYLGKRRGYGTEALAYKPQNTTYVVLGTIFLWFGWFGKLRCIRNLWSILNWLIKWYTGFNGGSALAANLRAAEACVVTNLAASVGGLTWMLWVKSHSPSSKHLTLNWFWVLGLSHREKVVSSRILLWCYRWSCGHHTRIWIRWFSWVFPFCPTRTRSHSLSIFFISLLSPLFTAAALVFGVMAGTLCNFATQLKFFAGYDDSLDVSLFEGLFCVYWHIRSW